MQETLGTAGPGSVRISREGSVVTVAFAHPKGNSLPARLLAELASAFDETGKDHDVSVIVLRSDGGTFCAGASFDELKAIRTEQEGTEFFSGFARLILAMRRCPKLIVARVQGKAVGGGVGLIAAADYVFAVPSASVRLSEIALGIGPFVVGPAIERRIGRAAFTAMALDADWRDSAWCERHGLYTRIVDAPAALDSVLPAMVVRFGAYSPAAVRQLKRALWEGTEAWETLLFERAAMSGRLVTSEQTRRAIQAFEQQGASGEVRAARMPNLTA
jgi:enoyl-CoA hydratase/carnithine racemase